MAEERDTDTVVEHPTYLEHIRHFFISDDFDHMTPRGIDLQTYFGVKFNAERIYFKTRDGEMPPPREDRQWSEARVQTFYNWMDDNFPRGTAPQVAPPSTAPSATRIRQDLASIDPDGEEMKALKRAFQGLMDRDDDDPNSYFQIAGIHWLPGPEVYCRHHENAYNPWHRAYLLAFEDALRSVEGCEEVTLPYWNIQAKAPDNIFRVRDRDGVVGIPDVLYEEPFAEYTLPQRLENLDGSEVYEKGSATKRRDEAAILCLLASREVNENIENALSQSYWENFNGWDGARTQDGIIRAHDNGHVACGETLSNQDVAAFDPMFWFFHANWDRLWWRWQKAYCATTLERFKTHLEGPADWLEVDVLNGLKPLRYKTKDMVDLSHFGVGYEDPVEETLPAVAAARLGSVSAESGITLADTDKVSVRLKGVDRLEIPGSFDVSLMVGTKIIGRQSLFQSTTPKLCSTCKKNPLANFDFVVDRAQLEGGRIWTTIDRVSPGRASIPVPLSKCGGPTINVRALLEEG